MGLSLLQFEALLVTHALPANPSDFALVAMLGLGLPIFEARAINIDDLSEEHG